MWARTSGQLREGLFMKKRLSTIILAAFCSVSTNITLAASPFALSSDQISRVEAGTGSLEEEAAYVFMCKMEPACGMALLQVWEKNGGAVSMSRFMPSAEQVPPLFRGTDMGQKLIEQGAVSKCIGDNPCRAFLVSATKTLRSLPPDQLKQVYQEKAQFDWEQARKASAAQVQSNLTAAIVQGSAHIPSAQPANAPMASPLHSPQPAANNETAVGEIIDFARDARKNVTFQLARLANGTREIQRRSPDGVKRLATVMGHEGKWLIEATDGNTFEAIDIQLTSRGFIGGTRGKLVSYTDGVGFSKVTWPVGFHTASVQRGNVTDTGYVLLERDSAGGRNSGTDMFDSLTELGHLLGVNKREDYILLDLHSGKNYPINLSLSGKNVTTTVGAYGCQKRNALINTCKEVNTKTRESLYGELGLKNIRHYIWAVYWFKAPSGTYLIALEDGFKNISVTKLETGEKRIAFSRGLGIADFTATQNDDGHIQIRAQLAFTNHDIDDLEVAFSNLPVPEGEKKNTQKTGESNNPA